MSASELRLAVQPSLAPDPAQSAWLERWLGGALGMSVRTNGFAARGLDLAVGDRAFVAAHRERHGARVLALEGAAADWLVTAWRSLRQPARHAGGAAPEQAAIDRGVAALGARVDEIVIDGRVPRWPAPYTWALALTHDVDAVDRWTPAHVAHLARHLPERWPDEGVRAVARLPWAALRRWWERPPLGRWLADCVAVERRHGVRATYLFFAPLARHRRARDGWYGPATAIGTGVRVADLWRTLADDGFEIGLHLSIGAHDDEGRIADEWRSLRQAAPALGTYRSHHLAERAGVTLPALARLGARVDLNLVADGFAWGSGLPVPVDDAPELYRLPTVIEDAALEAGGADAAVRARYAARVERVLDEAQRTGGLVTALLHPENPGAVEMVDHLIGRARRANGWVAPAGEIAAHWVARRRALSMVAV
jgi:hypothetical protein